MSEQVQFFDSCSSPFEIKQVLCDLTPQRVQMPAYTRRMAIKPSNRRDRQVVRILGILGALLEGSQTTVKQLAARFGTRRETIYRDLHALEDAGYPIAGDDSGRLSRPRILPEARRRAPNLRLSDTEIKALLWVAKQAGTTTPFRDALASAAPKLRAMANGGDAMVTAGIDQVLTEGDRGAKDYEPHRETILGLVEAIVRRRRCEVEYQSPAGPTPKQYPYDPYRLLSVAGGLYCIGKVPPHESLTTLAVDRFRALRVTGDEFEIDREFDAERHRAESFGVVWEKPMDVVVRFNADQAPYVRERVWHPTQRIRELPKGRVELTFRAGGEFEIARWLLGWGDAAEVIGPARFRERVRSILANTLKPYRKPPRGS
jgi:predicted DNA-binding transcriptional regulator YafY